MGETYKLRPASDTEGDWVAIPDQASLHAKLLNAESKTMPFNEYDSAEKAVRIEWTFQVQDEGDFFHRKVTGLTSLKFVNHADCRFYQWAKTLLGGNDLPEGFEVDLDDLTGLECIIQVTAKESPKKDGSGVWVNNNVVDVRPARPLATASVGTTAVDEEPF